MLPAEWLKTDERLVPGAVLFESPRRFQLWAQTVSHRQLLLRAPRSTGHPTRVEVLFKPVAAQKVRAVYDGLTIRCATEREMEEFTRAEPGVPLAHKYRLFRLDSGPGSDWAVALAVGWREDDGDEEISGFVDYPADEVQRIRTRTLGGLDGGLSAVLASLDAAVAAIRAGRQTPTRSHAYIHVVVVTLTFGGKEHMGIAGAFLTRAAAEEYLRNSPGDPDLRVWIETVPISLT